MPRVISGDRSKSRNTNELPSISILAAEVMLIGILAAYHDKLMREGSIWAFANTSSPTSKTPLELKTRGNPDARFLRCKINQGEARLLKPEEKAPPS